MSQRVSHETATLGRWCVFQKYRTPTACLRRSILELEPALAKVMGSRLSPAASSKEAWHFYRMYAAGQGLGGAELMRAVALAGRLKVERHGSKLHFALDDRPMLLP